jgi:electron transport complex protein RnfE
MCPALAVSNSAMNAIAMGLATTFVLTMSNVLISLLRNFIPKEVRIASYILIIATFVSMVNYVIQAVSIDLHKSLGAFIALIVVNCIILSRAEAFASKNTVGRSLMDGLGMGMGFMFALFCIGSIREIIGSGTFLGLQVMPDAFEKWVIMVLPAGGFFTLACLLLIFNHFKLKKIKA